MKAYPKPRRRTQQKHFSAAVVARGSAPLDVIRGDISATRRGQVYREDVQFTGTEQSRTDHVSPAEVAQIRELRAQGASILSISNELNRTQSTISAVCRKFGIEKGQKKC